MIVIRLISLGLIVAALLVLGRDAYLSYQGGEDVTHFVSLAELWQSIDPNSWQTFGAPDASLNALATAFAWPAFAVLGGAGLILGVLFRPWSSR
jgi:hypothetical protein